MDVIELDPSVPWQPDDQRPAGRRLRAPTLVLAVLMIVLNGPWPRANGGLTLSWQAEVVGGFFWLGETAAYTIEQAGPAATSRLTLTARDPADGVARWTADLTGPLAESYVNGWETMVSRYPPTLNVDVSTLLIDTRTGGAVRAYPAAAMPLVYLARDVAITIDRDPRNGPDEPLPALSIEATGADRAHLVVARDLGTGAVRWTMSLAPGTTWSLPGVRYGSEGIVALPAGQDWMITTNDGLIKTWSLGTGALVGSRDVGPLATESYIAALESTVIARMAGSGRAVITAYDPLTLDERWRVSPPAIFAVPFECGELLCLQTDRAVWAIDRAGAVAWRADVSRLRPAIGPTRLLVTGFGAPLALYDPATGLAQPADGRWRVIDLAPIGPIVAVARPREDGRADLGLLDAAADTIAPLGAIDRFTGATQCLVSAARVACEDSDALRVWRR